MDEESEAGVRRSHVFLTTLKSLTLCDSALQLVQHSVHPSEVNGDVALILLKMLVQTIFRNVLRQPLPVPRVNGRVLASSREINEQGSTQHVCLWRA